jgi:alpha-beta hydrolase superfamily lysophospholipase
MIRSTMYWDRNRLLDSLRPLSEVLLMGADETLPEMARSYCQFYGIDKENHVAGVHHRMGYFDAYGFQLVTHCYFSSNVKDFQALDSKKSESYQVRLTGKGTVFIFHGYFDHAGLYGHIIEYLLHSGFNVLIYDLPGHGLSSGESVAISHFTQYQVILEKCLMLCKGILPGPWFAVGQSTGAAVLLEYLFSNRFQPKNSPFQHWVLLAPLLRPVGWKSLVILHSLLGRFLKTWKREFLPNSHDSDFVRFLKDEDPLQVRAISVKWAGALRRWINEIESSPPVSVPVTIIQGPDDGTVDWRYNIPHLKQMLPLADIKLLVRGRHQLVNESPEIREKVFKLMINGFYSNLTSYVSQC